MGCSSPSVMTENTAPILNPDASMWRVSLCPTFGNVNVCWIESHCFYFTPLHMGHPSLRHCSGETPTWHSPGYTSGNSL